MTTRRTDSLAPDDSAEAYRAALVQIRETNHAIGNALVGIVGYAELILMQIGEEETPFTGRLNALADAARRVDSLSQEISRSIQSVLPRSEETRR